MPRRLKPAQQLRVDLKEQQRHQGHHGGPAAGGALLPAGPGRGVPVSRLQQRDAEAGRDPVHPGGGQPGNRWAEGGTWREGAGRGWAKAASNQFVTPKAELYDLLEMCTLGKTTASLVPISTAQIKRYH